MRAGRFAAALLVAGIPASAQNGAANETDRRAMLDRLQIADVCPGAGGFNLAASNAANYGAGTVETGDGWVDPKGSFLAAVAASPARKVLPGRSVGTERTDFPPVLTRVLRGPIGFRQHQGGHNNRDNWPTFIDFARARLGSLRR